MTTRATFEVVGIELGAKERVASLAHFAPPLQKALPSGKRLLSLEVSAGVAAQMRRTTVLAQALHGCEIREVSHAHFCTHAQFRHSCAQGKSGISNKVPLELSNYCASDAALGSPLGACAARDPRLRMRWLVTLANHVGLVGTVHRHLATLSGPTWAEPLLKELHWRWW